MWGQELICSHGYSFLKKALRIHISTFEYGIAMYSYKVYATELDGGIWKGVMSLFHKFACKIF
jgi:hypothetical protein